MNDEQRTITILKPRRTISTIIVATAYTILRILILFLMSSSEDTTGQLGGKKRIHEEMNNSSSNNNMSCSSSTALESLTIVSMNLAACEPSQSASRDWTHQKSIHAMRAEILKFSPDIIALQECPSPSGGQFSVSRIFPAYQSMGATYSHADQVILLVRRGISARPISLNANAKHLPAVMAEISWKKNDNNRQSQSHRRLLIASVHLVPFQSGAKLRKEQVKSLLQKASDLSLPLLFAGDTNMRVSEDATMEKELNLRDVWKLAGSNPRTKFTWNTKDNRKNKNGGGGGGGGSFNRYYGEDTRQYNARYDRIYISSNEPEIMEVSKKEKPTFQLIANEPVNNNNLHFLSDHFGMMSQIKLDWK